MEDQSMKSVEFEEKNKVIILHLDGDMHSCRVMNFEKILEKIMEKNPATIAVDCGKLLVLDPATISQLATYMKKARGNNIELVLYNLNPEVLLAFKMMKLDGFFTRVSQEQFEEEYINTSLIN